MRKFVIVFSALFFTTFAFCQTFNLEHHFLEGNAKQIDLDISGCKYMVIDRTNNEVNFYNPDYTLWKSVALSVPIGYSILDVPHVSEAKINPDTNLEIAYVFKSDFAEAQQPYSRIISENGVILLSDDFVHYRFSEIVGLDTKMYFHNNFDVTTTIHSLSGLATEGIYPMRLEPLNLEIAGGKFYSFNTSNNSLEILNPNLSLWKLIPVSDPITYIDFISETGINPDPLIEIGYNYQNSFKIINEQNSELLVIPNCHSGRIDKIPGLENKFFASITDSSPLGSPVRIYTLPSLEFETEYVGHKIERINLEISGEKYAVSNFGTFFEGQNIVNLYNSNHELWKSILLQTSSGHFVVNIGAITETIFASDDQVEVIYTTEEAILLDTVYPDSHIVNESGNVIFSQALSAALILDLSNATPRLISQIIYGDFDINTYESKVFGFDNTMGIAKNSFEKTTVYPNPSAGSFQIQDDNRRITTLEILNLNGQIIDRVTDAAIFSYSNFKLSPGMYIVKLTDDLQHQTTHKMIVGY